MSEVEALRKEAEDILAKDDTAWQLRSCHVCNPAHHHLTAEDDGPLICCFDCGRWYFRGVDITIDDEEAKETSDD